MAHYSALAKEVIFSDEKYTSSASTSFSFSFVSLLQFLPRCTPLLLGFISTKSLLLIGHIICFTFPITLSLSLILRSMTFLLFPFPFFSFSFLSFLSLSLEISILIIVVSLPFIPALELPCCLIFIGPIAFIPILFSYPCHSS